MNLRKIFVLVLAVSMVVFIAACSDDNPVESTQPINEFDLLTAVGDDYYTNYTNATGRGVNLPVYHATNPNLFQLLTDGDTSNDPLILDYRSATDYAFKHIKGAINIPLANLMGHVGVNFGIAPIGKCAAGQIPGLLGQFHTENQNL